MGIRTAVEALVAALKAEGALGACWGSRVSLVTSSQYVELSGNPANKQWPCLILTGPDVVEDKARRSPAAREVLSEDRVAATASVRPWPRFYDLGFEVLLQTRVGTSPGVTAEGQLLDGIERFAAWQERHRRLVVSGEKLNLFLTAALTQGGRRLDAPADLREATGRITLASVQVYSADPTTVHTTDTFLVGVEPE